MSLIDLDPSSIRPATDVRRLDNGLTVCVSAEPRLPIVATALTYRAGARDDGVGGTAHFLEHMMFKGSSAFGPGDIDRRTRALGGANNAYTSHDLTLYYFTFAADRWQLALDIEADRMAGLTLDELEISSERGVILEEIAMYEGEPWDVLAQAVQQQLFGDHPYGAPVIGERADVEAIDRQVLSSFHAQRYRPDRASLVIAGDIDVETAHDAVARSFGGIASANGEASTPAAVPATMRGGRLERQQGEVCRWLMALPAPASTDPEHADLRLLLAVLASGRSSRLQRALIDDGQLCVWVSADVHETQDVGSWSIATEVVQGVDWQRVEAIVRDQLAKLRTQPPTDEELARARRMLLADWLFAHERIDQRSFMLATALALFDLEHPWRYLDRLLHVGREQLMSVAERFLDADAAVVGVSLPKTAAAHEDGP